MPWLCPITFGYETIGDRVVQVHWLCPITFGYEAVGDRVVQVPWLCPITFGYETIGDRVVQVDSWRSCSASALVVPHNFWLRDCW